MVLLVSTARGQNFTGAQPFLASCVHPEHLSTAERHTLNILLEIASTTNCQAANDQLLGLTELNLSARQITALSLLSSFTQLQVLYLGQNQIADLSPLSHLTRLTALYLLDNQIIEIAPLAALSHLTTLYLDNNHVHDLTPLSHWPALTILYANHNRIRSLKPVAKLPNLTQLYLAHNTIRSVRPLQALSQLTHLDLGGNRIAQSQPLAALDALIQLDLSDNRIAQIDHLSTLQNLTELDLRNNPLDRQRCPVVPATVCLFSDAAADLYRQGEQQMDRGEFLAALVSFKDTLQIYQQNGNQLRASDAFDRIGNGYDELGQYANALEAYQQAAKIRSQIGDRQGEGETLTNLGTIYIRIGQTEKAIDTLQNAWKIDRSLQVGERSWLRPEPRQGRILSGLALAYHRLGGNAQSLRFAKQSLSHYRRGNDRPGETLALNRVGEAYRNLDNLGKARLYFDKALNLSQKTGDRSGMARSWQNLGNLALDLGQFDLALEHYQQAQTLRHLLGDAAGEGESWNAMGELWLQRERPAEAAAALQSTVALWESLRPGLTDADKISIAEIQSQTYQLLQRALMDLGKPETALEVSERGRARAFAELLAHRLSLRGETAPSNPVQPPTIAQIRSLAQTKKMTLVEYSAVETELLIWVVRPDGTVHSRRRSLEGQSLAQWVTNLPDRGASRNLRRQPDFRIQRVNFQRLYQLLIDPIADVLPTDPRETVVLIPQNELFLTPFAALPDQHGVVLLEKHPLLQTPAIGLLTQFQHRSPRPQPQKALVVGNPIMPPDPATGLPLVPLAGSEQEALELASLLNTQPLIGAAATKAAVLSQLSHVTIAHFATHGLLADFGTDVPGALALTPTDSDAGFLTAAEILTLRLPAQLVVLSACDTGRGRITGDGVVGLSRSFLTAGVENVVVSLWAVLDESTAYLMSEFYRQLEITPNRAIALQRAMLATRQQYTHPADWAAFTLFGEID